MASGWINDTRCIIPFLEGAKQFASQAEDFVILIGRPFCKSRYYNFKIFYLQYEPGNPNRTISRSLEVSVSSHCLLSPYLVFGISCPMADNKRQSPRPTFSRLEVGNFRLVPLLRGILIFFVGVGSAPNTCGRLTSAPRWRSCFGQESVGVESL